MAAVAQSHMKVEAAPKMLSYWKDRFMVVLVNCKGLNEQPSVILLKMSLEFVLFVKILFTEERME